MMVAAVDLDLVPGAAEQTGSSSRCLSEWLSEWLAQVGSGRLPSLLMLLALLQTQPSTTKAGEIGREPSSFINASY
ncbi:hypothetical protein PoB_000791300 [Plakobranchus ocellatus]|uniref:Uncharacterized protein n=1 Tax=Plakobranchus ocellatus TaxID=259542 RepID=A0AAV3YFZ5_9GAST|nr:hypothetical protein PoB_000791300 [Plakobranchus ocellatus]